MMEAGLKQRRGVRGGGELKSTPVRMNAQDVIISFYKSSRRSVWENLD